MWGFTGSARVLAGIMCVACGGLGTILLLQYGFVWSFFLVLIIVGICLIITGASAAPAIRRREDQMKILEEQGPELIDGILKIRAEGGNAIEYLRGAGITDFMVRQKALNAARKASTGLRILSHNPAALPCATPGGV